jgi:transcriptional regulator with XRE-family HTH domain
MSISISFGRIIKNIREERGISQEILADRADLNRSYVGEVERGTAMPSLSTITKLARALNLSAADLLARYENYEKARFEKAS